MFGKMSTCSGKFYRKFANSGGNYGDGGGAATALPQFNKTRKFSVAVGSFEGGIETAMKNQSPLGRKEFLF